MYEEDATKLKELTLIYEDLVKRLNACTEEGIISEYEKGTVIAMSKKVLEALTEKYTKVQKGVKKIMGGQILDYEAKRILNKGREEGRVEGEWEHLVAQVQKKLFKAKTVEVIAEELEEDIETIKAVIEQIK